MICHCLSPEQVVGVMLVILAFGLAIYMAIKTR